MNYMRNVWNYVSGQKRPREQGVELLEVTKHIIIKEHNGFVRLIELESQTTRTPFYIMSTRLPETPELFDNVKARLHKIPTPWEDLVMTIEGEEMLKKLKKNRQTLEMFLFEEQRKIRINKLIASKQSRTQLLCLPEEILMKIMSYLPPRETHNLLSTCTDLNNFYNFSNELNKKRELVLIENENIKTGKLLKDLKQDFPLEEGEPCIATPYEIIELTPLDKLEYAIKEEEKIIRKNMKLISEMTESLSLNKIVSSKLIRIKRN